MGKTSKPVRILVLDEDLFNSPEVQGFIAKGHLVRVPEPNINVAEFDIIMGRRAWYMDTKHLPYLEKVAIPAARQRITDREKAEKKHAA